MTDCIDVLPMSRACDAVTCADDAVPRHVTICRAAHNVPTAAALPRLSLY